MAESKFCIKMSFDKARELIARAVGEYTQLSVRETDVLFVFGEELDSSGLPDIKEVHVWI